MSLHEDTWGKITPEEETKYSKCSECNNCHIYPDDRTIAFCLELEDYLTKDDLENENIGEEACDSYDV